MTLPPCGRLGDYLARDLGGDELARFTTHLQDCPDCRRAVGEHERLTDLLSAATIRLEPAPAGLVAGVGRRLRAARRRRVALIAASIAVAAATLWQFRYRPTRPSEPEPARAEVRPARPATPAPRPDALVRVTFPADAHVIVVPEPIETPNVTFLWVYPGRRVVPPPAAAPESSPSLPER